MRLSRKQPPQAEPDGFRFSRRQNITIGPPSTPGFDTKGPPPSPPAPLQPQPPVVSTPAEAPEPRATVLATPSARKRLVLTLADEAYRPLTELTFPHLMRYAEKLDADFHVISDRMFPEVHITWEKVRARGFLDRYERIAFIDSDIIVRASAPDIFDVVPPGHFSAMDEGAHLLIWNAEMIARQLSRYGWKGPWNGRYWNSGVMVFDQTHKRLFENPVMLNMPYWEQCYLNVMVEKLGVPFKSLPPEFNCLAFHPKKDPGLNTRAYMLHFAGAPLEMRVAAARQELKDNPQP